MKLAKFKSETAIDTNPRKRGSKIAVIDDALETFHGQFFGANLQEQMTLTVTVFTACKDWLKLKATKSDYKERFLRSTIVNKNLMKRRQVIKELADQCLQVMLRLDPGLFARTKFERHKISMLSRGTSRIVGKSLGKGYTNERQSWLRSGKTQALSGSGIHDVMFIAERDPNMSNDKEWQKTVRIVQNKSFDELSFSDFEMIAKAGKLNPFGPPSLNVTYLKKGVRLQHLLYADEDGLLHYAESRELAHCPGPVVQDGHENMKNSFFGVQSDMYMYAMDSYGNLFATRNPNGVDFFNHSSFNSGREVTSAGMLLIQNGYLRWIDNNSGHYKPRRENLFDCVKLLANDGVDLSKTLVGIGIYSERRHEGAECYSAHGFLEGLSVPDYGEIRI